jgi:hypothetical protein
MPSLQVTGQLYLYHITMLFAGQCKGKGKDNLKVKLSLCAMRAQGQTKV